MKKIILASAIAFVSATPAFAASGNSSTASGSATATIVSPIVLTHDTGAALGFGTFTTGTGGSVTVSTSGAGSVGGDVAFVPGSTNSADSFTVAGDSSRSYSIATTGGNVTAGSTSIAFTTTPSATTDTLSGGAGAFTVGGTLTLLGTEAAGSYTGTYSATVSYN